MINIRMLFFAAMFFVLSLNLSLTFYFPFPISYLNAEELEKARRVDPVRILAFNRIDVSKIPLNDAIIMGSPKASKKVIMFTDPG